MHNNTLKISNWIITTTLFSALPPNTKYAAQVHGNVIVDESKIRNGLTEADGIITRPDSSPIAIRTADCLPLILISEDKTVALHISRKTLVAGILDNVEKVIDTAAITNVYLGPHICPRHFTFKWEGEGITRFKEKFPDAVEKKEKIHLSLRYAVKQYLDSWQMSDNLITEDKRCTYEEETLPSYRRMLDYKNNLSDNIATVVSYKPKN